MKSLNLAAAFLLELCLLVAFGYWGFHVHNSNGIHWLLGIGVPLLVAVLWSQIAAPKAKSRLQPVQLLALKIVLFSLGALGLYVVKQHALAIAFEVITLTNLALGFIWKQ
jgi:hypothetical protein